jgi:hypothetical protein
MAEVDYNVQPGGAFVTEVAQSGAAGGRLQWGLA